MRFPGWKSKNTDQDREEGARRLHEAAWPDMFANLQSAYAELTNTQFELERRTAEIAETRDVFQQVVSSMSEALFLTDRSGRVIRANPAAAALLECNEAALIAHAADENLAAFQVGIPKRNEKKDRQRQKNHQQQAELEPE